jgi:hypothetical protein
MQIKTGPILALFLFAADWDKECDKKRVSNVEQEISNASG